MHKKEQQPHPKGVSRRSPAPSIGLSRLAGRLMLGGTVLLTLALCDVAARIHHGLLIGEIGLWLRLGGEAESLLAAATVLLGGGLLLDYCERLSG